MSWTFSLSFFRYPTHFGRCVDLRIIVPKLAIPKLVRKNSSQSFYLILPDFSCYSWQDLVVLNSRRFYSDWKLPKGLGQVRFQGTFLWWQKRVWRASCRKLWLLICSPIGYTIDYNDDSLQFRGWNIPRAQRVGWQSTVAMTIQYLCRWKSWIEPSISELITGTRQTPQRVHHRRVPWLRNRRLGITIVEDAQKTINDIRYPFGAYIKQDLDGSRD